MSTPPDRPPIIEPEGPLLPPLGPGMPGPPTSEVPPEDRRPDEPPVP